jgi:electron transport complex protein RnfD
MKSPQPLIKSPQQTKSSNKSATIELRTSPHVKGPLTLPQIMLHVIYALLPICAFAIYQFGLSALVLIIIVTLSCLLTEALFNKLAQKTHTLNDYTALITGILLALTLPPGFPLWMGAVAGFVAIALGKTLFGGIGFNLFNPALIGRAFVQAAFPVAITSWTPAGMADRFSQFIPSSLTLPFTLPIATDISPIDGFSGATPLALHKFEATTTPLTDLFLGFSSGSLGETSCLLILLCGSYLILRGIMSWRIPLAVFMGATLFSGVFYLIDLSQYPSPLFMLTSGGLMLGALFMATDPVSAPVTPVGMWLFGLLIGVLTIIIRLFGGLPEGIMYAILFANASVPLIEAVTQPRKFGKVKTKN